MSPNERSNADDSEKNSDPITLFETITEGGFGRMLKHEHGAILELVHHEEPKEAEPAVVEDAPAPEPVAAETAVAARSRRRISVPFHIRRRSRVPQQTAGPSLQVVDADAHNATETPKDNTPKEQGIHVTIQLDALNEAGALLLTATRLSFPIET